MSTTITTGPHFDLATILYILFIVILSFMRITNYLILVKTGKLEHHLKILFILLIYGLNLSILSLPIFVLVKLPALDYSLVENSEELLRLVAAFGFSGWVSAMLKHIVEELYNGIITELEIAAAFMRASENLKIHSPDVKELPTLNKPKDTEA